MKLLTVNSIPYFNLLFLSKLYKGDIYFFVLSFHEKNQFLLNNISFHYPLIQFSLKSLRFDVQNPIFLLLQTINENNLKSYLDQENSSSLMIFN
jgi:hypothetical protein